MSEIQRLQEAIGALEAQRTLLGDAVVDAALTPIRDKLAALTDPSARKPRHAGERKLVTVMFADLSGFTALSEKSDPEDVRGLMNDCFTALVPIVERYGGVVDKFIGDEIMALFGAPAAHENDAERALHAALEMREVLSAFNAQRGLDLGMHFGINTGLVVAGGMGSEGRQQYSVVGDTVNLAARLKESSEIGQILVGPTTQRLTAPVFQFEIVPPLRLKGKAEPVPVHRLLARRATPGPLRGLTGLRSPMIGRTAELNAITQAVNGLSAGTGRVFSIVAEAGLGKSRLVSEARQATQGFTRWAEGRAASHAEGVSYGVARTVLDDLVGVGLDTPPTEIAQSLRAFVELHLPDRADQAYPYLARLRGLPAEAKDESTFEDVLPAAIQSRMRHAFADLIRACASRQPLVLVWEDMHWSDPSSFAILESLLPLIETHPLLLLQVFRPGEGRAWSWHERLQAERIEQYRVLELTPLTRADSSALVDNLLRIEHLPEGTRELILSKSEGNPFFLEELLRSLLDAGLLLIDQERVVAADEIQDLEVPSTLHGVIAARLDRLAPEGKVTLQVASVIGRVFQQTVLNRLIRRGDAEPPLTSTLRSLEERELIRWRGEFEYIFKHAITRDVTYNSLLIARRKELHRQVAESLELLFPDRVDELAPTLAYHYDIAEDRDQALRYLVTAADRAQQTYANTEAVGFLRSAIRQLESAGEEYAEGMAQLGALSDLHERVGSILTLVGRSVEARAAFESAITYVSDSDPISLARLHRKLGLVYNVARQTEEMFGQYARADAILGPPHDAPTSAWIEEWLDLQLDYCWVYYFSSRVEELNARVDAIAPQIEQHGTAAQRARFNETLILADLRRHRYYRLPDETVQNARRQLIAAEEVGSRHAIGRAKVIKGFLHLWRDELDEAEQLFTEGLRDTDHVGDLDTQLIGWSYTAVIGRKRGDVAMTREWAERSLALAQVAHSPVYIALAHASLGWAAWRESKLDDAERLLEKARSAMADFPVPHPFRFLYAAPLLALSVQHGRWPAAIELARGLLDPVQQRMPQDVETALAEAVSAWEDGRTDEATAGLARGLELMRERPLGYL